MRISDWSSDVCSSDLAQVRIGPHLGLLRHHIHHRAAAPRRRLMEQAGFALERRYHIARSPRPDLVQRLGRAFERDLLMLQYRPARCAGQQLRLGRTRGSLDRAQENRSEEHTSELKSLMRI